MALEQLSQVLLFDLTPRKLAHEIDREIKLTPASLEHPHAVEVWDRVVRELYPRGLRPVDYEAVRLLSSQAAVAYQAAAELRESDGLVIMSYKGAPIANPLVKIERDAATLYLRFAERFGLDVASRMRLGLLQLAGQSLADALQDDLERD